MVKHEPEVWEQAEYADEHPDGCERWEGQHEEILNRDNLWAQFQ